MIMKRCMSQDDVSGILMTYSYKATKAQSTEQLHEIVRKLREELDLRRIKHSKDLYED